MHGNITYVFKVANYCAFLISFKFLFRLDQDIYNLSNWLQIVQIFSCDMKMFLLSQTKFKIVEEKNSRGPRGIRHVVVSIFKKKIKKFRKKKEKRTTLIKKKKKEKRTYLLPFFVICACELTCYRLSKSVIVQFSLVVWLTNYLCCSLHHTVVYFRTCIDFLIIISSYTYFFFFEQRLSYTYFFLFLFSTFYKNKLTWNNRRSWS